VFSAREFVWWYNGHPDAAQLPVDLRGVSSVAIAGIGALLLLGSHAQITILALAQKTALSC
jgi:adrenodoxin-NADP+ reductase